MYDRQHDALGEPLPIGYLSISQYARDNDIPRSELAMFVSMVRALDDEWMRHMRAKSPPAAAPAR